MFRPYTRKEIKPSEASEDEDGISLTNHNLRTVCNLWRLLLERRLDCMSEKYWKEKYWIGVCWVSGYLQRRIWYG